ncbi:hypothetical protein LOTGIDRAFT_228596 [Lottia gigantea]|uniref:Uncharacterized protein n=1 Tax=Lottia gigantea TaxID=225164 RepID=V4AJW8_LOTGI|nr:hypothetical protein LOTGIDRAFT_228596 [Lottia gigantea]ESO93831.1 hypothetical protein LOTGIDRAFT_228596 [Lottia gigantea]
MGNRPGHQHRESPYPGPSPDYRFINLEIGAGQEMMSRNVEALARHYNENFRLLCLNKTLSQTHSGMVSPTIKVPNQAINIYRSPNPNEVWRLQIEKSVIESCRTLQASSQLIKTMSTMSEQGGRLICIEETVQQVAHGTSGGSRGSIGVDVFFDMPTHPNPHIYEYHLQPIPMEIKAGSGETVCSEWASFLEMNLWQGLRLVDIFIDKSNVADTIWFFETIDPKTDGITPMYEGTVVDHCITLQDGFSASCGLEFRI